MAEHWAEQADVIVVGGGLSGLVAATEIADAGKRVIIVDQEGEQSLGGQAFWSFGGLFLVDSPEQRRLGIKDSFDLAMQDWLGTAGFDRDEDFWPRKWAEAYVAFAAGEKRDWLRAMGHRIFPVVGWAERGGYDAMGHGNSVPRFHVTWGTGPGIVEPFERRAHGAGGRAEAVDDDGVAGLAEVLVLVDISSDPATAVVRDPNHRVRRPHACDQANRRKQPRQKLHCPPPQSFSNLRVRW